MSQQRLFFAIRLSAESATDLSGVASRLKKHLSKDDIKLSWMDPVNYHVTLRFLGERSEYFSDGLVQEVSARWKDESPKSFTAMVKGIGTFPDPSKARVLWAGASDKDGGLVRLADLVDKASEKMGIEQRENPFEPHVTLGRSQVPFSAVSVVQSQSEQMFSRSGIKFLELLKTQKITGGYMYKKIASWPLI